MQTAAHSTHSYIQLHTLQGQHKAGNDKHIDQKLNRKAMPYSNAGATSTNTQSSKQGIENLNTAYQTEHIAITLYNKIHITQIFNVLKTVLNYRMIAIGCVK
jgi:hypothetical protein